MITIVVRRDFISTARTDLDLPDPGDVLVPLGQVAEQRLARGLPDFFRQPDLLLATSASKAVAPLSVGLLVQTLEVTAPEPPHMPVLLAPGSLNAAANAGALPVPPWLRQPATSV